MRKVEMKSRSRGEVFIRRLTRGLLPLALGLLGTGAAGQPAPHIMGEPSPLDPVPLKALRRLIEAKKGSSTKLQSRERVGREIRYNLGITKVTGKIYNPSTDTDDVVER